MNQVDYQYLEHAKAILKSGDVRPTRNGLRHTLFGTQMGFDLQEGFPLLTTKKVNFHAIATELCWFLRGSTNIEYLNNRNVHIWDDWADSKGNLGPVYGKQWRSWEHIEYIDPNGHPSYEHSTIDQIDWVIKNIRSKPYDTRHIVTAWNPAELDAMALPPCHCLFQFDVTTQGYLNCQLYQRSADWFLGVPFNIASYALLVHIIASRTDLMPGHFIHTFGNYHLYDDHLPMIQEQLWREHRPLPRLILTPEGLNLELDQLEPEMFVIEGYDPHPGIKAPISV